ncbi:MAG TPA: hypothetical protein VM577_14840 [Anaerovoracaceae bacterium]|nr:hypothetical protein [Anaerovoracaceae bacterium]
MKTFRLWVVVLHPGYENQIVMCLIKKGYKISPLAGDGKITTYTEGYLSATVSIKVETDKELDYASFRDLIKIDLNDAGVKYHALIVESGGAGWTGSNIKMSQLEQHDTGSPYRTVH